MVTEADLRCHQGCWNTTRGNTLQPDQNDDVSARLAKLRTSFLIRSESDIDSHKAFAEDRFDADYSGHYQVGEVTDNGFREQVEGLFGLLSEGAPELQSGPGERPASR